MVPWEQGKYLVWDATCIDTFCQSHSRRAAIEPGGAAAHTEEEKAKKYAHLDSRRLKMITGEPKSHAFLMQRISVAIQVGNAMSVIASLPFSAAVNIDLWFNVIMYM